MLGGFTTQSVGANEPTVFWDTEPEDFYGVLGTQPQVVYQQGTNAFTSWNPNTMVRVSAGSLYAARRASAVRGGALGFGVGLLVGGLVGVMIMKKR